MHIHLKPEALEVEISSVCDSSCIYCSHTIFRDIWPNRLLDVDLFNKIVHEAKDVGVKYVYLQGWMNHYYIHSL